MANYRAAFIVILAVSQMPKTTSQMNPTKILFVCHGNICRSPMAEYIAKDLVKKAGIEARFEIASAATSREEIGNPIYPPAQRVLTQHGIAFGQRAARQITPEDYRYYDHIVIMDLNNQRNLQRLLGEDVDHKVTMLMSYAGLQRDVADPWYTGDFETAFQDILAGCEELLRSEK